MTKVYNKKNKPEGSYFLLEGPGMPLWNFQSGAVSRWKSHDNLQILVLFPLPWLPLKMHEVRKSQSQEKDKASDQEVSLSGTESKEDPHPLDGTPHVQEIYLQQVIISSSRRWMISEFMVSYLIRKHSPKAPSKQAGN